LLDLEHDPEKWIPVFRKRSCSIKRIERDGDSKKSHLALAGFSFAFAGRGKFLRVPFKPMLLGAADATGEANLAAHRCSNFLCR